MVVVVMSLETRTLDRHLESCWRVQAHRESDSSVRTCAAHRACRPMASNLFLDRQDQSIARKASNSRHEASKALRKPGSGAGLYPTNTCCHFAIIEM